MVDRAARDEQPLGDVGVAKAFSDEHAGRRARGSSTRPRSPASSGAALVGGRGRRAPAAPAPRSWRAARRRADWQLGVRIVAAPRRHRSATARAPPRRGRSASSTRLLPPAIGRRAQVHTAPIHRRHADIEAGEPSPELEPRDRVRVAQLDGSGEHRCGRGVDLGHRALEPCDLRTGGREIHMGELLLERHSDGIGIGERVSGARVAPPRAHEGENAQCLVVRPGRALAGRL